MAVPKRKVSKACSLKKVVIKVLPLVSNIFKVPSSCLSLSTKVYVNKLKSSDSLIKKNIKGNNRKPLFMFMERNKKSVILFNKLVA